MNVEVLQEESFWQFQACCNNGTQMKQPLLGADFWEGAAGQGDGRACPRSAARLQKSSLTVNMCLGFAAHPQHAMTFIGSHWRTAASLHLLSDLRVLILS